VPYYDTFFSHAHPAFAQKLLIGFNRNVIRYALASLGKPGTVRILEIGPGKGYFHRATKSLPAVEYSALDRNGHALDRLEGVPENRKFHGAVPALPVFPEKFDIIYAGFVLEHLPQGGADICAFVAACCERLNPGGLIVAAVPNAEKLGMEFWNNDYTHMFPTSKRSIAMAFYDNGFAAENIEIFEISGLLTHRFFTNRFIALLLRLALLPYQYKFFQRAAYYLRNFKTFRLDNVFFQAFAFAKLENLLVFARKPV
jgi:SAM-dependent methyltransferase